MEVMNNPSQPTKIYEDQTLYKLPTHYDRDIVKILIRNPLEAFVFWGISSKSLKFIQSYLRCNLEEIFLKLHIKFWDDHKHQHENIIDLPPFTDNWLIRFDTPPHHLKVELVVFNQSGDYIILLHSAFITLPKNRPSYKVDKAWVNPGWVTEGHVSETKEGELVYTGTPESVAVNPVTGEKPLLGGSSGYMGSSEHLLAGAGGIGSSDIFGFGSSDIFGFGSSNIFGFGSSDIFMQRN